MIEVTESRASIESGSIITENIARSSSSYV